GRVTTSMAWRYAQESNATQHMTGDPETKCRLETNRYPLEPRAEGWRRISAQMMLTQDTKLDLQGRMQRLNRIARVCRRRLKRNGRAWLFASWGIFTTLLATLSSLMLNPTWRHWTGHLLANVFILGGVVAAPLVSVVGWIGVALPPRTGLHEVA